MVNYDDETSGTYPIDQPTAAVVRPPQPSQDVPGSGFKWLFDETTGAWKQVRTEPMTTTTPGGTTTPPPGGAGMTEEQGRLFDQQHGLEGGYMTANGWVSGSPRGSGYTPGGNDPNTTPLGGGGLGEYQGNPNWPTYTAPGFVDPGAFDPGPTFTYKDFVSPSADAAMQEPGFQFRMDQGRKALESSAAGKGVLRSGGTLKDILGYGQNFASQEYGNVWNRALTEYDTNRENAFGAHQAQYGQRRDAQGFGADRAGAMNTFNTGTSQFGFNAQQRQAELDAREAFDRWSKSGDWTRDIVGFGAGD